MVRKNRFTKALIHLKSTELDEKIQSLKEGPTNKTTGVYSLGKKGVSLSPYEPPKKFFPDKDGNWPEGVPGVPGEGVYVRPGGFWDGGRDWDSVQESDFSYNNMVDTNNNTTTEGLISPGGFVQTALPPNSRHFILGPLVDSYTYNHGYDSYTTIGYLQKDTRQFVALGRIWGQWKAGLHGNLDRPNRVWDPTNASVFESYNPEFTLEMAQWVSAEANADRFYSDVPYFYSGGVMQSIPTWGQLFGNLWPTIGGLFGNMFGGLGFGGGGNGGSASTATPGGAGFGSGDPSVVTTGQQLDGDDPSNHGNSGDNGLWGGLGNLWNDVKDQATNLGSEIWNNLNPGDINVAESINDIVGDVQNYFGSEQTWENFQNLNNNINQITQNLVDTLLDLKPNSGSSINTILEGIGFAMGTASGIAVSLGIWNNANTHGSTSAGDQFLNNGLDPFVSNIQNDGQYGIGLGLNLIQGIVTGQTTSIHTGHFTPEGLSELGGSLTVDDIKDILSNGIHVNTKPTVSQNPQDLVSNDAYTGENRPEGPKQDYRGTGFGGEGATIIMAGLDNNGKPVLYEVSDKFLRVGAHLTDGGFTMDGPLPTDLKWNDIPEPTPETYKAMVDKVKTMGFMNFMAATSLFIQNNFSEFSHSMASGGGSTQWSGGPLPGQETSAQHTPNYTTWDQAQQTATELLNDPIMINGQDVSFTAMVHNIIEHPLVSGALTSLGSGGVNGTATGVILTSQLLSTLGLKPTSGMEQEGAYGHVHRDTTIGIEYLGEEQQALFIQALDQQGIDYNMPEPYVPPTTSESVELSEERKIQILKDIKKPVLIEATPMKKLSGYKPKFKSKSKTPPTKPQSAEQLVASGNAKGQSWREEDKHWQGYETTERLNIIRHQVGHGEAAWNQIIEDARVKNGWKNREMQEQLNIISHERALKGIDPDFESPFNLKEWQNNEDPNRDEINIISKDPLVKQVKNRILSQIDYKDKPSRKGYPDGEPPKLGRDGFHPDLGRKKSAYYKRLDSVSALAMPKQGDEEIDAEVDKQKKKYVNPKVAESWKSDWRDSLTNA